jgi:hypothetical protein
LVGVADYGALMECRKHYAPRKFKNKRDAQALVNRIARKGGEAIILKERVS